MHDLRNRMVSFVIRAYPQLGRLYCFYGLI